MVYDKMYVLMLVNSRISLWACVGVKFYQIFPLAQLMSGSSFAVVSRIVLECNLTKFSL